MSISVTQQPLLITAFDPFKNNQSHTHRSIADRLNISEQAALAALERLEGLSLLVCARDGTDTPVWRRHPEAETSPLVRDESD